MNFSGSLLVVQDLQRSRRFYYEVLGLDLVHDFGANIVLTGGMSLQTQESWLKFISRSEDALLYGGLTSELYFEEANFDAFLSHLDSHPGIEYVHPPVEHSWGQRAVRFYDPDHHLIEVGECLSAVCLRFMSNGLTVEQTAVRMDVSPAYMREMAGL